MIPRLEALDNSTAGRYAFRRSCGKVRHDRTLAEILFSARRVYS